MRKTSLHELQASKTLQDLEVGDHIDAYLREAPKCPETEPAIGAH